MRGDFFFDVHLGRVVGLEVPVPDVISTIMWRIHANAKGLFAVAFPEMQGKDMGSSVRVFSDTREVLERLRLILASLPVLGEYMDISGVSQTPSGITEYECFQRVKFKSVGAYNRRCERRGRTPYTKEEVLRSREQRFPDNSLGIIQMRSASTGQTFPVFFRRQACPEGLPGHPGSYGLSKATAAFHVPVF